MFNPLEFQKDAIDELSKAFLNLWKKNEEQLPLVLKSPTGSGKTFMVSHFMRGLNHLPNWDEDKVDHTTSGTFGESFAAIVEGAAVTGTLSVTEMTTDLTEDTDDHYNGRTIVWITGNLAGQITDVTGYVGSNKKLVFTAVTDVPVNTDRFILV